jgi:hypothetical protein
LSQPDWMQDRRLVAPEEWLGVVRDEYLTDFISSGGAAVKVVSGAEADLTGVSDSLRDDADALGYTVARLDPGALDMTGRKPDLHRIDRFFFAATTAIDWQGLAMAQAYQYLTDQGIRAEDRTLDDIEGIAADNGRDAGDLLAQYQRELATPQLRDYGMALEFRTAVTALGRAQLLPEYLSPTLEEILLGWFAGRTMPGASAALKKLQIFERINQSNARQMLLSFCRWLPRTGSSGLVLVLDFRPYEHKKVPRSQKMADELRKIREAIASGATSEQLAVLAQSESAEPDVTYSDAAYMQMLTLIRQFIDEIDWFDRMLLVVLTSPKFYDSESRRNYNNYDALQTRIGLEVQDARRANPAAALVHLGVPT